MKIEIEVYKGQTIEYDDDYDKFICDISCEDKNKTSKRNSLKDLRKEIDAYLKQNLEFKPFKALFLNEYDRKDFTEEFVSAIRTDGKFVVGKADDSYKSYVGKNKMSRAMIYDAEIVKEKKRLKEEKEAAITKYNKAVAELCKKLVPVDLSKYDSITNPETETV